MLLLEHVGKTLLRQRGIAIPAGHVVATADELDAALARLPNDVVLKAQIAAGRRGKGGGIAFAASPSQARAAFAGLMGTEVNGHRIKTVLVEERVPHRVERYAGLSVESGELMLMFAATGGIDIEEFTQANPSNLAVLAVDPFDGLDGKKVDDRLATLSFDRRLFPHYRELARKLLDACRSLDALTIEINPLVERDDGTLCALDARIVIDETALDRQPTIAQLTSMPAHREKGRRPDLPPIRHNPQGGSVGLIGLGAGLNITIMDWMAATGAVVRSLVDIDDAIGAGRAEEGFAQTFAAFDADPGIRAIMVNIITCGYRLDDIVAALTTASTARPQAKPTILHLRGNAMSQTPFLLSKASLANSASLGEAIRATARAAGAI